MSKRPVAGKITQTDYRRLVWDRMEDIDYPGEHADLYGHDNALNTFAANYHNGRIHHAWLITGPHGIGKATFALAVAAHMLRHPVPSLAPPNWISPSADDIVVSQIGRGGHPNLLHLSRPYDSKTKKFKSSLTVDEVRRTISFFGTTAGEDSWRVCIVDSADDMNTNAANALLKILEEPPARTVFFVIGNSPGKLLPTIRSRCRQLALRPLNTEDLQSALAARGVDIGHLNPNDMQVLGRLSAGSVRKAIVLLEQDGLRLVDRFEQILNHKGKMPDWPQIHKIADELSRKNKQDQYNLLFDIVRDHISNRLHSNAPGISAMVGEQKQDAHSALSSLARLCEVWEKSSDSAALAEDYNLDKKQVILNLFGSLSQTV